MTKKTEADPSQRPLQPATRLVVGGRDPSANHGFVNPPVHHVSTVLYPTAEDFIARRARYLYGRRGTPTSEALENALRELEGPACAGVALLPSGLAAISTALLAGAQGGRPPARHRQRLSADAQTLQRLARALRHRHDLLRPADRRRHRRAHKAEHARGVRGGAGLADVRGPGRAGDRSRRPRQGRVGADGQYLGEPALFPRPRQGRRPFDPGRHQIYRRPFRRDARHRVGEQGDMGAARRHGARAGALRRPGRYLPRPARLAHHGGAARPSITRADCGSRAGSASGRRSPACFIRRSKAAPATPSGSAIFPARAGCSASCSSRLREAAVHAFLNELRLFGMGASWGGFESLAIPFDCTSVRTATKWAPGGPTVRFHIGLEDVDDLIGDLERGFAALAAAR